jgi:hypothetical protein
MKYIINESGIVLFMNGSPRKIKKDEAQYAPILKALRLPMNEQENALEAIFASANPNADMHKQGFQVNHQSNAVSYKGELLPTPLAQKVISLIQSNLPVTLLEKFWENLKLNPSYNSVRELYDFLSYKELPITEDGCFIAYRGLRNDFFSVYGNTSTQVIKGLVDSEGRIYNGVGEEIEVARNCVDDDRDNSCSFGVHAGSYEYAKDWSRGRLVAVKINPKDVVSVPKDFQCQKLRCCAYTVIAEIKQEIESPAVDDVGQALENKRFKNDNDEYHRLMTRVSDYLFKQYKKGHKTVTFKAIQGIFSPDCPTLAEVASAVDALGYTWGFIGDSQSKQVMLRN